MCDPYDQKIKGAIINGVLYARPEEIAKYHRNFVLRAQFEEQFHRSLEVERGGSEVSFDFEPFVRTFECPICGGCVSLSKSSETCQPDMWVCESKDCTFEREAK